ncbi:MAG: acetylglutamate kinase [Cyclobacteriaceae bacterium]
MKEKLYVVKIGGNVIDQEDDLNVFIQDFSKIEGKKILVHGGGKIATQIGKRLGIKPNYYEGRRITDDATINLCTMVYGGLINKKIAALLCKNNCPALGLTGADGHMIKAHKRPVNNGIDFGWVGDVDDVNNDLLKKLIDADLVPVLAPLTVDYLGNILNTNADTIASVVAASVADHFDVILIYCFEKNGVLTDVKDSQSLIPTMDFERFEELKSGGSIQAGMLPKMTNSFDALNAGVSQVVIGNSDKVLSLTQEDFAQCTRINL